MAEAKDGIKKEALVALGKIQGQLNVLVSEACSLRSTGDKLLAKTHAMQDSVNEAHNAICGVSKVSTDHAFETLYEALEERCGGLTGAPHSLLAALLREVETWLSRNPLD